MPHRRLPAVFPVASSPVQAPRRFRNWHPNSPPGPGEAPTPPPLPENLLLGLHRKLPSAPPASTQEVRNPKIGQQLGAQPTPRFRGMLDALLDAMFDPLPPFTFCCPQAIVDEEAGV